ncbi:cation-translocating P-type ATPase [Corynebacterium sp.]|uniref:heavy metal translocating P-type ATPase n=1 Tax=Corynebacterium sp. TaxID=1720 RepID=UPI0026DB1B0F|nr:HAD-IC family P-type ATPase [Corynebacterium sp.]MDO5077859.1 HAD-IC family P-type ATPase [Corynebacterium sp.]
MVDTQELHESARRAELAIQEAKAAAVRAGLSGNYVSPKGPLTAFAFELEGLESVLHVREIEQSLRDIEGIQVTIIYPSKTAWVSAPDSLQPSEIIAVFAEHGVRAELTQSSLHRRAQRLEVRRTQKYRHSEPEREETRTRTREDDTDVLFTARSLITRTRLIVSLVLALPVLLLSFFASLQFDYWQWLCLFLSTPVVTWGAWPFHRAMAAGLRRGLSALDSASSVAISAAYIWSAIMLVWTPAGNIGYHATSQWFVSKRDVIGNGEIFFDVACGITVLLLLGRVLGRRTQASLLDVTKLGHLADVTVVRKDPRTGKPMKKIIPVHEIRVGDDIIVPTNGVIPSDGQVVGGAAEVQSGIIGSGITKVKVHSQVYAGSVNRGGPLKIRVQRTGSRTRHAAVRRWVLESSRYQNRSAQLATRSASLLVPWALTAACANFGLWWLIGGNLSAAFATSLAILACVAPVALALSTPLAMRHGLESAARQGILIRSMEKLRDIDGITTIIFNRLGTLSQGEMKVETVTAAMGENPELVLRVAGALAIESDHPSSRALVRAAREARDAGTGGDIPHWIEVTHLTMSEDGSFSGMVEIPAGNELRTCTATLWRPRELSDLNGRLANAAVTGGTPLVVSWRGRPRGVITLLDKVKDDAVNAIAELEGMGVETVMLTRDTYPVARRFADNLGISRVLAGIGPARKEATVRSVHARGATVALIGDSTVLSSLRVADVGVLVGADTLDFPEADVVLLREDVSGVVDMLKIARKVSALADQNIVLSWAYNGVAMVLSAAGLVHPMAATMMMIGSSLLIEYRSNRARHA